ncbi:MAG: uroporphyrinogen decarboxylase family protein [Candidatus Coatesbacteria bacterium]
MNGEEVAARTLWLERVAEPCLLASWAMHRGFFREFSGRHDIYADPVPTVVGAYLRAGANLCPQFVMPSRRVEHLAADPFAPGEGGPAGAPRFSSAEDVRDWIEALPDPATLAAGFDTGAAADAYARPILKLRELAGGGILFLGDFGQSDFMGGYTRFGYDHYLEALALYPEHLARYFSYTAEEGRLANLAVVRAVAEHGLAPFVYGGQDICFNAGPICSLDALDRLYFPALARAVEPLHAAGIRIVWHCDGDVRPVLGRLVDRIGVAGFQGFQEETGCTLEGVAARKTREGRKLVLWGSVSVTTTLPFGAADDVRRDVERCFRVAAPGGGFALASTSSILPETPLDNIRALYDHGLRFGREFLGR